MFQYPHFLDLRKAWKKYDPDNMHSEIDSCDYSCVDEYYDELMKVQSTSY